MCYERFENILVGIVIVVFCFQRTELHRVDTEEYRTREAEAERHAQEIQSSLTYSENTDLENGDEEMLFSAVHRPDETASVTAAGNGGKFSVPQHRNAQTGAMLANRPQKLVVLPSTQTEVLRSHHPPAIVPTTAGETAAAAAAISSSSGVIRINGNLNCWFSPVLYLSSLLVATEIISILEVQMDGLEALGTFEYCPTNSFCYFTILV